MKRTLVALCLCLLTPSVATAQSRLAFKTHGFSIAPLEAPAAGAVYQALMMFLPSSDNFAPNVNVQIQKFAGTLDAYLEVSRRQFLQLGLKVIKLARLEGGAIMEYSGPMQNRDLHFYAKVAVRDGKAYLATGTATNKQWPAIRKALVHCVGSFDLLPAAD